MGISKKQILKVKKLVSLLESEAGKKVKLVEAPVFGSSEPTLNSIVDELNSLSEKVDGLDDNMKISQVKKYILGYISEIIGKCTKAETTPTDNIQEVDEAGVSMSVDQAEKDTDALKKLNDKDISVKLTDGTDDKNAVII